MPSAAAPRPGRRIPALAAAALALTGCAADAPALLVDAIPFVPTWLAGLLGTLAHVALSTAATIHILMRRRDVSAAIGWIGVVWLVPLLGALLYVAFGINRIHRRALKLRYPTRLQRDAETVDSTVHDIGSLRSIHNAVERVTGRRLEPGNAIETLSPGDVAYPPMLEAIRKAKRSVLMCSYIFQGDGIGMEFVRALAEAHGRGVKVRVIIDGIGGGYWRCSAYEALVAAGVPAQRFMHTFVPWRMPFLNMRTHKKLLVADGEVAFLGGLNVCDQHVLAKKPKHPVFDTHFRVRGPVVGQLVEAFLADWLFAAGEKLDGPAWFAPPKPAGGALMRAVTSGPDMEVEKLQLIMQAAIASSRKSIFVVSPYFLPAEKIYSALEVAALRGVEVDIVMPRVGDHRLVNWAMHAHVTWLLRAGCRVWYSDPPFNHSKLMIVDHAWAMVGSANWDVRSVRLNFELNVEIYDAEFAASLEEHARSMIARQLTLETLARRNPLEKLRDAAVRLFLPYL